MPPRKVLSSRELPSGLPLCFTGHEDSQGRRALGLNLHQPHADPLEQPPPSCPVPAEQRAQPQGRDEPAALRHTGTGSAFGSRPRQRQAPA